MKALARWSVENRVLVNILMVTLAIWGLIAFRSMNREVFPLIDIRFVTVVTSYPGVSPEEIEQLVTIPLENAIDDVDGLKEIRSSTSEGLSMIVFEADESIDDISDVARDIEAAVRAVPNFPVEAEEPVVEEVKLEFPVIDVAVVGHAGEEVRREVAKRARLRMEQIPGVSSVVSTGIRDREIWAEVDPDRLYQRGLPVDEILLRLRQRFVNLPAGTLQTEAGEVLIRTTGIETAGERVESFVIRPSADGNHTLLRDVGRARETYEEADEYARANGRRAIRLHVVKSPAGDTVEIAESVQALIADMEPGLPQGVEMISFADGSIWIHDRLQTMYQSGLWGLALLLVVLNLFLEPRIAAMTALGLPLAIAGGLVYLNATGGSLNMLSMFAFILVLGIVVDDAIVISENTFRYLQRGMMPAAAAVRGVVEVSAPVVAGVATTIAAFLPLLLTAGIMGEFLEIVPTVAAATLITSLIEAFLILPSHLADFVRPHGEERRHRTPLWFRGLRARYQHVVASAIRYRYVTVAAVVIVALIAIGIGTQMRFILFDDSNINEFMVNVKAPPGSSLEETEQIVVQAERILLRFPTDEIAHVVTAVGEWEVNERPEFGPNLAMITVELADYQVLGRPATEIFDDARARIQESVVGAESIELRKQSHGPPVGRPVYVQVKGEELDRLALIADEIAAFLEGVDGVFDIGNSFQAGKDEIRIAVDETRSALYGLSTDSIGRAARTAMEGTVVATVQEEDEEIDVRVRYLPEFRRTLDDIDGMRIATPSGRLVPFGNVAALERTGAQGRTDRVAGERMIAVFADVDTDVITATEAVSRVRGAFADIGERHPGYHLDFGGETEETTESLTSLAQAFLIVILVIYAILGGMFKSFSQPFVIMFAIPFSFVGVVTGFFLLGLPLSFIALFGIIALTGVVVNDSLLLVHFINRARNRGSSLARAVTVSAKRRFRPVMLTTLTTIAGMSPLALARGGQAEFLAPMAMAIVWGLAFSTVLVLILVPALYMINEDVQALLRRTFRRPAARSAPASAAADG
jgi:multidrug efflux pump subunit AcrB